MAECGFYSSVEQPALGRELTDVGAPYRLSVTPAVPLVRAPRLAEHNEEVYKGLLGLSDERFVELLAEQVIY